MVLNNVETRFDALAGADGVMSQAEFLTLFADGNAAAANLLGISSFPDNTTGTVIGTDGRARQVPAFSARQLFQDYANRGWGDDPSGPQQMSLTEFQTMLRNLGYGR